MGLLLLTSLVAFREGPELVVETPPSWDSVHIETVPETEWTRIGNTYRGTTTANQGVVRAAICDGEVCIPVTETFNVGTDPVIIILGCVFGALIGFVIGYLGCMLATEGVECLR